jgi:hypothetical protein
MGRHGHIADALVKSSRQAGLSAPPWLLLVLIVAERREAGSANEPAKNLNQMPALFDVLLGPLCGGVGFL